MNLPLILNKTRLIGILPRDEYATADRPGYPSPEWVEAFERWRPLHLPLDFISLTEPGVTNEALLAIVIDRLEGFQNEEFACFENAEALRLIQGGLRVLNLRTSRRQQRGVEGKAEA